MPREKVQEIAKKGGQARAEKARKDREDRERGLSGNANLEDELEGEGERVDVEEAEE